MVSTTIRCDEADKKAAAEVAAYYGLDLSSVTRALWKQIGRTRRIPLDLSMEEPNDESLAALAETEQMIASGSGASYKSGAGLLAAARA